MAHYNNRGYSSSGGGRWNSNRDHVHDHDRDRSRSRDRRVDQQHHNNQYYGPGSGRPNSVDADAFPDYRDHNDDHSSSYSNQSHHTNSNHYNKYGHYNNNQRNHQQNQISSSSRSRSRHDDIVKSNTEEEAAKNYCELESSNNYNNNNNNNNKQRQSILSILQMKVKVKKKKRNKDALNSNTSSSAAVALPPVTNKSLSPSTATTELKEIDKFGTYAICCTNCRCTRDNKAFFNCVYSAVEYSEKADSGNKNLWHRDCCHPQHLKKSDMPDYTFTPMMKTINNSIATIQEKKADEARPLSDLQAAYNASRAKERQIDNSEYDIAEDAHLNTNEDYNAYRKLFLKREPFDNKLVVLSLFSGIGSCMVTLKRLGLPIKRVIHVEHDPVANYVFQHHHNSDNDGIEYVHINKFEDIYGGTNQCDTARVQKFIEQYGHIDIVLSAAPCHEYAQVNAYANRAKRNAQYLPNVGTLIKEINKIQSSREIRQVQVLFLSENVVFKGSESVWPYYGISEVGLCPVRMDAKDFSPQARNRFFWTNIPFDTIDEIKDVALHYAVPGPLLDKGFQMIETACQSASEKECMTLKANTSMACKYRINDERMKKVFEEDGKYYVHTYSVREREVMAGLPENYISVPMKELFEKITYGGFLQPEIYGDSPPKGYKDFLEETLWHFAEVCKFKLKKDNESPFFKIEISAPQEGQQLDFYDCEGYSKRLIGNGWSIPVIEHLLRPVLRKCNENRLQSYKGYDYVFPWQPYNDPSFARSMPRDVATATSPKSTSWVLEVIETLEKREQERQRNT